MPTFEASVQYNDWIGTAAADDADRNDVRKLLSDLGVLADDEFLLGIEMWLGEMHGDEVPRPYLHAFIIDAGNGEIAEHQVRVARGPLPVKQIDFELSMEEFFLLFKRFAIHLSSRNLNPSGRNYDAVQRFEFPPV
jgi:hypothetical protein